MDRQRERDGHLERKIEKATKIQQEKQTMCQNDGDMDKHRKIKVKRYTETSN